MRNREQALKETIEARAKAERLLHELLEAKASSERNLRELRQTDAIAQVTGRSSLDQAAKSVRAIIESLGRAAETLRREEGVTLLGDERS